VIGLDWIGLFPKNKYMTLVSAVSGLPAAGPARQVLSLHLITVTEDKCSEPGYDCHGRRLWLCSGACATGLAAKHVLLTVILSDLDCLPQAPHSCGDPIYTREMFKEK